ncbi:MAG: PAS domain S-box protein [Promethearchaeota archaeon]
MNLRKNYFKKKGGIYITTIGNELIISLNKIREFLNDLLHPIYAWKKSENDFILVYYNSAAKEISKGNVKNFLGSKASELYKDRPDILDDLHQCGSKNKYIFREMKYYFKGLRKEKCLSVYYCFFPPNFVLVHTEDMTKKMRTEQLVKCRLKFERVISTISSRFIGIINFDKAMNNSLSDMGKLSGASRSYLFLIEDEKKIMINTHEWCAEGVIPQIENLQAVPIESLPWWKEQLFKENIIHISDVSKLPIEAENTKKILESQNIKSLLVFALHVAGNLAGFIGLDNIKETGEWGKENIILLQVSSEIIGNALNRKWAEETLDGSQQLLKGVLSSITDYISMIDEDYNIVWVNNIKKDLFDPNLIGKKCYSGYHKRNKPCKKCILTKSLADGGVHEIEIDYIGKDGKKRVFWCTSSVVAKHKGGQPELIAMNCRDITKRKKMEKNLQRQAKKMLILNRIMKLGNNTKKLSFLLKKILNTILELMNFDGGGIFLTDKVNKTLKLSCNEGLTPHFLKYLKRIVFEENTLNNISNKRNAIFIENTPIRISSFSEKWGFLSFASILLFSKNKIIGALVIILRNRNFFSNEEKSILKSIGREIGMIITKMQAEQKLKESKEKFKLIAEQSITALCIIQDNKFKYINQRLADIVGYTIEEMKSWQPGEFIKLVHPEDKEMVLEQAIKKQIGDKNVINRYKYRGIKKNGEIIWIENYSKTITYEGKIADLAIILDITEGKKKEKKNYDF